MSSASIGIRKSSGPLATLRDPRLEIVQANVLSLPFANNSFDMAMTAMFLHHLSDQDAARRAV